MPRQMKRGIRGWIPLVVCSHLLFIFVFVHLFSRVIVRHVSIQLFCELFIQLVLLIFILVLLDLTLVVLSHNDHLPAK